MKYDPSWEGLVEQVDQHGRLHWPGLGNRDFWVQRVGWLDVTRSMDICLTVPHADDESVPFVGEALLRSVYLHGSRPAMADLMLLLWKARRGADQQLGKSDQ